MRAQIKCTGHHNLPVGLIVEVVRKVDDLTVFIRSSQVSKTMLKFDLNFINAEGKLHD